MKLRSIIPALLLVGLATGTVYGADVLLETQTSWDGAVPAEATGRKVIGINDYRWKSQPPMSDVSL